MSCRVYVYVVYNKCKMKINPWYLHATFKADTLVLKCSLLLKAYAKVKYNFYAYHIHDILFVYDIK
jgi:hypothetical protein